MTMRTYQHSGVVPASGALVSLATGTVAGLLLGVTYAFTFYYIPYVYLNFLLVAGFGAGVGWVVGCASRYGKIRNVAAVGGIATAAALAGIYAEWGTTIYAMADAADLPQLWSNAGLAPFLPTSILALMADLFVNGSWG